MISPVVRIGVSRGTDSALRRTAELTHRHDQRFVKQASFFQIHIGLADVTTFLGIGGLVLAVFTWATCKNALVPTKDPRLLESINHENF